MKAPLAPHQKKYMQTVGPRAREVIEAEMLRHGVANPREASEAMLESLFSNGFRVLFSKTTKMTWRKSIRPIIEKDGVLYISLNKGFTAIADAADREIVEGWNWRATPSKGKVYVHRTARAGVGKLRTLALHRAILPPPSGYVVDHINGDGLDNRRSNLRWASTALNCANRPKSVTNTSGFKGVHQRENGKWRAICGPRNVGHFETAEEAARAYDRVAVLMYGPFAHLNFPASEPA